MKAILSHPALYQAYQNAGGFFGARIKAIADYLTLRPGMRMAGMVFGAVSVAACIGVMMYAAVSGEPFEEPNGWLLFPLLLLLAAFGASGCDKSRQLPDSGCRPFLFAFRRTETKPA
jgi:hypothetical protein